MKRLVIALLLLSLSVGAMAQDLLVKRSGEQLRVKVLKVTKKKVEYVRQGTDAPVYTLPTKDIDYIEYPMGDRDIFGKGPQSETATTKQGVLLAQQAQQASSAAQATSQSAAQATDTAAPQASEPKKWHGAVPAITPDRVVQPAAPSRELTDAERELPQYAVGDLYEANGLKGIVISVTDEGRHGLIASLDEACLAWCTLRTKLLKRTGADNRIDGRENMKAIEQYIAANGLSWSDFPAFEWCRNKGEGWFMPSLNEVWLMGTMYNGGSRTNIDRKFRKTFNARLKGAGGILISNIMYYGSSTESRDVKMAHYSHMNSEQPHTGTTYKGEELFVRAFHHF